jgi:hypothetical protein
MEYKMKKPAKKMMYGGKMPYADKMAGGGKTGMRGQVKKDDMNKKAVNSAVKEAMDSTYEGKINPPKEPDMGVAKARMSRPTGPDRKEMAYNRRRSASEGRTVAKLVRWLWAVNAVVWAQLPRVAHSLKTGN